MAARPRWHRPNARRSSRRPTRKPYSRAERAARIPLLAWTIFPGSAGGELASPAARRAPSPGTRMAQLSQTTLDALPKAVARPLYDRGALKAGIVHLGIGAFHRAHQAVATDDI